MRSGERGYTLVGLMVAVAVVNITLTVAVTSWTTLDRRAREAELIWRGQQIGRAIACYQGAQPTEPLTKLEQLVEADCLRRLYPDPMVKDGQWRILTQQDVADGTVAALTGQAAPGGEAGAAGLPGQMGQPGQFGQGGQMGQTGRPGAGGQLGLARLFQRSGTAGSAFGGGNGIVGVVSKAPGEALRTFAGRQKYGEWVFLAGGAPAGTGAAGGA